MFIETIHETTPEPRTPEPKSLLGRFLDLRLDKRGASFSMRSSRANACACANWPPAPAPSKSRSAIFSPTRM
jgi:hypothetical protein